VSGSDSLVVIPGRHVDVGTGSRDSRHRGTDRSRGNRCWRVVCRLTYAYRVTSDLDTVNRRRNDEPAQLELLLASGAERSGVSGVLVPTSAGPVQVDVLEVSDADLTPVPDDPTDRLHVLSHAWAASSATSVRLRASGMPDLSVLVANPGRWSP
jgi:hypothetical protein